jgi:hypothetical protein
MHSKTFARDPLQSVSIDSTTRTFLRNSQTKPGIAYAVGTIKDNETDLSCSRGLCKYTPEFQGAAKPVFARKAAIQKVG